MQSKADIVEDYLKELPKDRREVISSIRKLILDNLPDGYKEVMQYGMISYVVPLETFPETYNKKPLAYISLTSQKNYLSLYMNNIYSDSKLFDWFSKEFEKAGKKLNMGKSCVRFTKLDNLPLDVIAKTVAHTSVDDFIQIYKHARKQTKQGK